MRSSPVGTCVVGEAMSSVVFFGKVPRAADFVRRGVSGARMRPFENWLHEAYTDLRGTGERGLRFRGHLIMPDLQDPDRMLAAVAVPSRDRIGREFPAVVVTAVPRNSLPRSGASLGMAFARFWTDAIAAVESHQDGEPDALFEAVEAVAPPTIAEVTDAERRCAELLSNLGARQMEEECFAGPDDRYYAYHTLRLAVRDARDHRVLECPSAGHPGYRAFWIEAIAKATEGQVPLPVVWLEGPDAPQGMLVALGKPPATLLRFATGHGRQSNVLWPLTTDNEAARGRAKDALLGENWDDPGQKLSMLIDAVVP